MNTQQLKERRDDCSRMLGMMAGSTNARTGKMVLAETEMLRLLNFVQQVPALVDQLEEAERERDELRKSLQATQDGATEAINHAILLKEEITRRDAAAGEPVALQVLGDSGKWMDCISREFAEAQGFSEFRELYTAAQPAVLPTEEREIWRNNLKDACHALSDIRRFVETKFMCVADLQSADAVLLEGPESKRESDAIIAALNRVAEFYEQGAQPQKVVDLRHLGHVTVQVSGQRYPYLDKGDVLHAFKEMGIRIRTQDSDPAEGVEVKL